ncbi:MAG: hypothetical protein KJ645_09720, partial [Planctomycetes bacterium]|nr:hypothetical protein [Planctomycetota bacterium]
MKSSFKSAACDVARSSSIARADLWIALALLAIGWFVTGLYFDRGLDAFDAGLFASEAERVAAGGVYGKDFLAPYGPGRYYLIALLFSVFGTTLKVQAGLWLVLRGLVGLLVFLVGRSFVTRKAAVLPALAVILAPGALHKSFFQAGALCIVLSYLICRRRNSMKTYFAAGVCAVVVALFRVDVGVFGALSFLLLLLLENLWDRPRPGIANTLKRIAAYCAGAALILLPVLLYFQAVSDPVFILEAEWHRTLSVSGFAGNFDTASFSQALASPDETAGKRFLLACLLWSAPLVYLLLALTALFKRTQGDERWGRLELFALVLFGLPVLNQVRITPTFNHLLHTLPLVLIAWTVCITALGSCTVLKRIKNRGIKAMLTLLFLLGPLGTPVYYNLVYTRGVLPGSLQNRWEFTEPMTLSRAKIFEKPVTVQEIERLVRYIESTTHPDDPIFAGPFSPALNFLAHRPPAIRFLEPFYYFRNEKMQRYVVEDLKRTRPPLILIDPSLRVGGQGLETDAPLVYGYILN